MCISGPEDFAAGDVPDLPVVANQRNRGPFSQQPLYFLAAAAAAASAFRASAGKGEMDMLVSSRYLIDTAGFGRHDDGGKTTGQVGRRRKKDI